MIKNFTEATAHDRYPDAPAYILPGFRISAEEFEYDKIQTVKITSRLYNEFFWIRVLKGEFCFEL